MLTLNKLQLKHDQAPHYHHKSSEEFSSKGQATRGPAQTRKGARWKPESPAASDDRGLPWLTVFLHNAHSPWTGSLSHSTDFPKHPPRILSAPLSCTTMSGECCGPRSPKVLPWPLTFNQQNATSAASQGARLLLTATFSDHKVLSKERLLL